MANLFKIENVEVCKHLADGNEQKAKDAMLTAKQIAEKLNAYDGIEITVQTVSWNLQVMQQQKHKRYTYYKELSNE